MNTGFSKCHCFNLTIDNTNLFGNAQTSQKTFSKSPNLSKCLYSIVFICYMAVAIFYADFLNLFELDTNEIKQVVDTLNRPPFMCNLSLVEFDDKAP